MAEIGIGQGETGIGQEFRVALRESAVQPIIFSKAIEYGQSGEYTLWNHPLETSFGHEHLRR